MNCIGKKGYGIIQKTQLHRCSNLQQKNQLGECASRWTTSTKGQCCLILACRRPEQAPNIFDTFHSLCPWRNSISRLHSDIEFFRHSSKNNCSLLSLFATLNMP